MSDTTHLQIALVALSFFAHNAVITLFVVLYCAYRILKELTLKSQ